MTMGVADLGRAFYTYEALVNAAREGARFCALNPGGDAQARVAREVEDTTVSASASPRSCPAKGPSGVAEGDPVTIIASATFSPVTPFFPPITLSAAATMVMW